MFNRKLKQRVRDLEYEVFSLDERLDNAMDLADEIVDRMGYEIVVDFCDECGEEILTLEEK